MGMCLIRNLLYIRQWTNPIRHYNILDMDFKMVLRIVLGEFEKENVRYALIGGLALGALGVARSTVDVDFLESLEDMPKVDNIMKANDYECAYTSENVSQYISSLKMFGEIDFLHAFRKASVGMLDRASEKEIFGGELKIRVIGPEDMIGLKLQAAVNDDKRRGQEYADIESVLEKYASSLDWNMLEEYFEVFGMNEKFVELRERFCGAE